MLKTKLKLTGEFGPKVELELSLALKSKPKPFHRGSDGSSDYSINRGKHKLILKQNSFSARLA